VIDRFVDTFVDTSALITLLDADDPRHDAVGAALRSMAGVRLVTHAYVVAETIAVARRRLGVPGVRALIDGLLPVLETVPVTAEQHATALARYRTSLPSATSFVDQVSFEVMRDLDLRRALALDADFAALGVEMLPAD